MVTTARPMTADELLNLPDDGFRYELIVVNPRNRTVDLHRSPTGATTLTQSDTLQIQDILPGWRMPIQDIFE